MWVVLAQSLYKNSQKLDIRGDLWFVYSTQLSTPRIASPCRQCSVMMQISSNVTLLQNEHANF